MQQPPGGGAFPRHFGPEVCTDRARSTCSASTGERPATSLYLHPHPYPCRNVHVRVCGRVWWWEAWRYGLAPITLRIIILRWLQTRSFRSANGVIFLTNYAKQQVTRVTGELSCKKLARIIKCKAREANIPYQKICFRKTHKLMRKFLGVSYKKKKKVPVRKTTRSHHRLRTTWICQF